MIFLLMIVSALSPSAYVTCGNHGFSNRDLAFYLTLPQQNYTFFAGYDLYREGNFHQHLFTVGLSKLINQKLSWRPVLWYYTNSLNNSGVIVTNHIYYGINHFYSLSGSFSIYNHNSSFVRKIYGVKQLNSQVQYYLKPIWISCGLIYNAMCDENYLALTSKLSVSLLRRILLEVSGLYGNIYYLIDDETLILNNRSVLQKGKWSLKLQCAVTQSVTVVFVITRNIFRNYHINYLTLGLKYRP
jgi:hypothetical protein